MGVGLYFGQLRTLLLLALGLTLGATVSIFFNTWVSWSGALADASYGINSQELTDLGTQASTSEFFYPAVGSGTASVRRKDVMLAMAIVDVVMVRMHAPFRLRMLPLKPFLLGGAIILIIDHGR